jgi:transposase InsO family protein
MNISTSQAITKKWELVLNEYELVKRKASSNFKTVEEICSTFKVHRKDIRKYYERWAKSGKDQRALLPHTRGPKPGQLKILSKEEERTIIKIHRKLGTNEFEMFHMIKGNASFRIHPSVSTIYRTLKRYPLNKQRKEKIKRYEKRYPGELIHADTYSLAKTLFIDRQKYYLVGLLDDCTRLTYVELIPRVNASVVTKACFNGIKWFGAHGINPEVIMTDNGIEFTAFTSQKAKKTHFFETMLSIFNIKHIYTRPYRPQTNGKIERFWKTLSIECLRLQKRTQTKEEFIAELNGFLYRYNYERRHSALKYTTPLDKLKYVTEILK